MTPLESRLEKAIIRDYTTLVDTVLALLTDRQFARAERLLGKAMVRHRREPYLRYLQAIACFQLQKFDQCMRLCRALNHAEGLRLLARCLQTMGRVDEALPLYQSLYGHADVDQDELAAWHADALITVGRYDEALALVASPSGRDARTQAGRLHLGFGRYDLGFDLYRARDMYKPFPRAQSLDEVRGKTVMLFAEQGLGDSIQFLRFAPLLRSLAGTLIICVPRCLVRLAATIPGVTVISEDDVVPTHDVSVAMVDCPYLFGTTIRAVPDEHWIDVPSRVVAHDRPMIGLCWAGGFRPYNVDAHNVDQRRSMAFEMMAPLLALDGFDFVSLQMEPSDLPSPLIGGDFYDSALALQGIDLVITVDTAIAHLAGSLGRPVWLLSRWDGCWRWGWDRTCETTPWYGSMRIFRQSSPGAWPQVIEQVVEALKR